MARLPNFLIVGAARSGTTSLARHLGAHSDAFVPEEKELRFFDDNFDRGLDWYGAFFADAGDATAVGEATAAYLYNARAVERMATVVPQARLIAMLRQPVDRAYSNYWMNRERGREKLSFTDAIAEEPQRMAAAIANGETPRAVYLEKGRYVPQLVRLCEHFPRESLQVVITEDLASDPVATFGRVCTHVGIDPSEQPERLGEPLNRYVHFRSRRLRARGRAIRHPLGRAIERINVRKRPYPPIDPVLRARLTAELEDEIIAVEQWLGRDLANWRA
jgi:hypothetical protein